MPSPRVFFIEDGDRTCLTGTFYPMAHVRFDADLGEFIVRDDLDSPADSLRSLRILKEQIGLVAGPSFAQFDEVRSWTPINTQQPVMEGYVAFGPTEDCAILIYVCRTDGTVETIDAQLWVNGDDEFTQVVELFERITGRWDLLFETADNECLTRADSLKDCISKMVVRL